MITLIVGNGENQRRFEAHQGLLVQCSDFFRAALKDCWAEGADKSIKLPEAHGDAGQIFFYWLYKRTLYEPAQDAEVPLTFEQIVGTYVFGDAHRIPELRNAAMDVLGQKRSQTTAFPTDILEFVYNNTLPGCPLRKYLVHDAVRFFDWDILKEGSGGYPKDFAIEAILEARHMNVVPGRDIYMGPYDEVIDNMVCYYHDHSIP